MKSNTYQIKIRYIQLNKILESISISLGKNGKLITMVIAMHSFKQDAYSFIAIFEMFYGSNFTFLYKRKYWIRQNSRHQIFN